MSLRETKEALEYPIMESLYPESSSKIAQSGLKLVVIEIVNIRLYLTKFPALYKFLDRSGLVLNFKSIQFHKQEERRNSIIEYQSINLY